MLLLEAFFKFTTVGLMLAIAMLIWRDGRNVKALRYGLPLLATLISMLFTTGSESLRVDGGLFVVLRLTDYLSSLFIWLLGLALFDDDFELGWAEKTVIVVFVVLGFYARLHYTGFDIFWSPVIGLTVSTITLGMMMHLVARALLGRKEDLLEKRRRARIIFTILIALVLITAVVTERTMDFMGIDPYNAIWVTYLSTLPICAWSVLWLLRLQPEAVAFQDTPKPTPSENLTALDPRDAEVHTHLVNLMEQDQCFTEHGLTIGALADKVSMPAHQLRALINRSMGYQNFSAFLNHYRIAHVQSALSDPKNARVPVLTLAMDAGFSSLAPFNRAFKAEVGITPTEFRNQHYSKFAADSQMDV